jgi:DNA-binding MarR family transcriptional regulator
MNFEEDICYLIIRAGRLIKSQANRRLNELGITFPQYCVLKDIQKSQVSGLYNESSPARIAQDLFLDRPTVTGIIDRLVKDGLLLRIPNQKDRRSRTVILTENAARLIQSVEWILETVREEAVEGIDDIQAFNASMHRVSQNLAPAKENKALS